MKALVLLLVLPLALLPASATEFRFVSFEALAAPLRSGDLAQAVKLKERIEAVLTAPDKGVRSIKEGAITLDEFQTLRDEFYVALSKAARWHRGSAQIKALADWGFDTWVALDPAIDLHSERLVSQAYYDALKLK